MANQEHLDILRRGVGIWNLWREEYPNIKPDLSGETISAVSLHLHGINLSQANLKGIHLVSLIDYGDEGKDDEPPDLVDLTQANLSRADLSDADLSWADLSGAELRFAKLHAANLRFTSFGGIRLRRYNPPGTDLSYADLRGVDLTNAVLDSAIFNDTNLSGANLSQASMWGTIFASIDFRLVNGLETVRHVGPSTIGLDSIIKSQGNIPEIFLRQAGVPASIIEQIPSLIGSLEPIQYYTCFISYSSKDQDFAECLYADLQAAGVRCWFAPEDMKIGDRIRLRIDESIRLHDKLLLVLSEHSVASKWVEFEVEAAMDKEQEGKPPVLFPVRLDGAVMKSTTAWAAHIKRTRNIGDFTQWKNHDDYQKAFERLLRDLKASS
jgi:uncharacterized protein YjbI with pentapeptide repeats